MAYDLCWLGNAFKLLSGFSGTKLSKNRAPAPRLFLKLTKRDGYSPVALSCTLSMPFKSRGYA